MSTVDAPFPQPDVGHAGAHFELLFYVVQGGYPRADKVGSVARTKELFATMKNAVIVFVPAHSGACTKGLCDARHGRQRAQGEFEGSRQISPGCPLGQG